MLTRFFPLAVLLSAIGATAAAQEAHDPCSTDLSRPLDAYLCSEQKLSVATAQMKAELTAVVSALPAQRQSDSGMLVTKRQLQKAQAAWSTHVNLHCALVAELPGRAGDWHFSAANQNFCQLHETELRLKYLTKWRTCSSDGGSECLP
jgi:uncharacterized protein YecT (DUF1311 family)